MWAVTTTLAAHELRSEIQIRLVLIVSPAAQRDIACLMPSTFAVGIDMMEFYTARASAATPLIIDERASATVTSPHLAPDRRRDGAGSAVATSIGTSGVTLSAEAGLIGDRRLFSERIVE